MMFNAIRVFVWLLLIQQECKAKGVRGDSKNVNNENVHATDANAKARHLHLSTGAQTVLVVLVSSSAGEKDSTLNATYLEGVVFGTGLYAQSTNLISQYRGCSHGVLQLKPATTLGTNVKNGVLELTIPGKIAGGNIEGALQTTIVNAAQTALRINDIRKAANHVMFCLPGGSLSGGSTNWVSFSHTDGSVSWYQNGACAMLSPAMHENGHNLGFYHSGLGTNVYGDTSGYMGYAYRRIGGPKMCFNAHKNWISGWFENRKVTVNPGGGGDAWVGTLTAFVDDSASAVTTTTSSSSSGGIVQVIHVGNLYLQLNSAKKFNQETRANRNQVAIVKASSSHDVSWLVAGLSAGQSYTYHESGSGGGGIIIHVCLIQLGIIDYARLSIYLNDGIQTSKC